MLYGQGRDDMAAFVGQHPLEAPPGSFFRYSSGDSVLLSAIARAALEPRYGPRYASAALFEPLGIRSAVWEADAAGTLVGSSWLHLTPRDMARYGLLWLDQGCWDGARIFPEGWVARSTQVNPAVRKDPREWGSGPVQGWQVWLNQPLPEHGQPQPPLPDAPATAFAALGHWRQAIWVLPEQDLLVIRTGDDRDDTFTHNELLRLALAFAAAHPAPEAP
jgi:CubicO group peptidase (beta-lactamase class C family)